MNKVRYRTEAFSGSKERDAAEVMAFETFTLGNTDLLEYISQHHLKDPKLLETCSAFIKELDDNGYVDDMSTTDKVDFFRQILDEIEKETGIPVKYALWLADKSVVCDRKWYGRNMLHDEDFDSYEVGPVILSDLGHDGALYGYTELPVCLEDRIYVLQDELADIINQRVCASISKEQALLLDRQYDEISAKIQVISAVLTNKSFIYDTPDAPNFITEAEMQQMAARADARLKEDAKDAFRSLASQIEFAESRRQPASQSAELKATNKER